ncbi:hypothetical protein ACYY4Z_27060 (plasmid) [Escherichia coli]
MKEQDKGIKDPLVPYFHEIFPYFSFRSCNSEKDVGIGLISRNTISGQNGEELNERRKKRPLTRPQPFAVFGLVIYHDRQPTIKLMNIPVKTIINAWKQATDKHRNRERKK